MFSGTTASPAVFLAGPLGKQVEPTTETSATRRVSFEVAAALITQTKSLNTAASRVLTRRPDPGGVLHGSAFRQ